MKWVGLTGGIATGKSAVSELLRSQGIAVIDADQVAREVVAPGTPGLSEVLSRFGSHLRKADGSLDRKALGASVFGNKKNLMDLENILHPLIQHRVKLLKEELVQAHVPLAFYDVPLLFEKKMAGQFDSTVLVWCTPEQQVERLMKRDGLNRAEADRRIAAQISILEKKKLAHHLIDNSKSLSHLAAEVGKVLKEIS